MGSSDSGKRTVPLIDALIAYERKGVGIDMTLKTVLGVSRLFMIYSKSEEQAANLFGFADAIVECRMLCNFGRPGMTAYQGYTFAKKRKALDFWYWLFNLLSTILRFPEQLSGDLNYLQKTVMHSWSRARLSFYYRFFKSLSLTCGLLAEICRHRGLLHKQRHAKTPASKCKAKDDLFVSNLLIVRSLADMYVYYKWIPQYNPIKTIEYSCGALSGLIGVYLVWKDVRFENVPEGHVVKPLSPEAPTTPTEQVSPTSPVRSDSKNFMLCNSHLIASPRLGLSDSLKDSFIGDE